MNRWRNEAGDALADLQIAIDTALRDTREPREPRRYSDGLQALAEAFAARHGFTPPPPRPASPRAQGLDASLRFAIDSGILTEPMALDVDAFADGITARVASGELTRAEADAIVVATATRDGEAFNRARAGNRQARRAEAAQKRRRKR